MESRSAPRPPGRPGEIVASDPTGTELGSRPLTGERVTVGRLPEVNDIALQPDPERLVTREAHCTLEREGAHWVLVDGGSLNGTFLRRGSGLERVSGRTLLQDGDVICVLGSIVDANAPRYFELSFNATGDSQATRAVLAPRLEGTASLVAACVEYGSDEARLFLVLAGERHEVEIRAQAHRLVRYMAERNADAGGLPVLCTHDELMHAVWGDEPMHTRVELARLVWELRRKLEPFGARHVIESERRLGYRMLTCRG